IHGAYEHERSNRPLLDEFAGSPDRGMMTMVEPRLKNAASLARGLDHGGGFGRVSTQGLFTQNVFAALQGGGGDTGKRSVDCGHHDGIDVASFNQLPPVG